MLSSAWNFTPPARRPLNICLPIWWMIQFYPALHPQLHSCESHEMLKLLPLPAQPRVNSIMNPASDFVLILRKVSTLKPLCLEVVRNLVTQKYLNTNTNSDVSKWDDMEFIGFVKVLQHMSYNYRARISNSTKFLTVVKQNWMRSFISHNNQPFG